LRVNWVSGSLSDPAKLTGFFAKFGEIEKVVNVVEVRLRRTDCVGFDFGVRVAGVWSSGSSIRGAAAPVREDNGFEGTLVCVWLVRDEEPGSRSCPSGFRVEIMCWEFHIVSCVDVLVLKTVLPFCQAVKVLAFLTMPLEASSKDANQQLEFPWGLKSAVDNEHGSFGKRLEPTIRLCKKGFKG
ncbi:hypothetical protein Droror1_Dr00017602, partial [Drosera rotundifolia]